MSCLTVEQDPDDPYFICLIWEGEKVQTVHKRLFSRHLRDFHRAADKKSFLELLQKAELNIAHRLGIYLLARRGYFSAELKERLQRRRLSEEAIDRVIFDFVQKGYIDDSSRLDRWIAKEFEKGHGSKWIYQMLKKKVSSEEIKRLSSKIQKMENASLQKYLSKRSQMKVSKDRKKQIAQLLRRGYSYEAIRSAGLELFT